MNENHIFPFLWMRGEPEEIIRREIRAIAECGIRAFCVEARPHEDFCGPLWWRDMDIVIDEAKKQDMKIWILDDKHFPTGYAAGLIETKYPERKKWYLADTTADIFGSSHERTLHVSRMLKPVIGYWQIGQPADEKERKNNKLAALLAVKFAGTDGTAGQDRSAGQDRTAGSDGTAAADRFEKTVIDLTETVNGEFASFTLPEGQWRVHAIYTTRTDGGNEAYINMLDAVSAHTQIEGVYEAHYNHYPEEFGRTIAGFFSDEPELGNTKGFAFDDKVGKKGLQLPWSDELACMLKERWGREYVRNLAWLFAQSEDPDICPQIRFDYMDCVSLLYERNFSCAIGSWCAEHNVEYIGHVVEDNGTHSRTGHGPGHWFRAMTGQDMAGIDVIGSQMIFGAPVETRKGIGGMQIDGEFFHYILGKLGASAGHLDPEKKGRTMCELFGAYGWDFGVRDMRYLLDQLLVRGVNNLVPHAFSMAQYPDPDCPPHFYAGGNNGQFSWFKELMYYANRMCEKLSGGTHVAQTALLYDGEADWAGEHMPMQKPGRALQCSQIEFDVVSLDMLRSPEKYNGCFDGKVLEINGVCFGALVIPYSENLPEAAAEFAGKSTGFPVIFINDYPERFLKDSCEKRNVSDLLQPDWKKYTCTARLDELPDMLRKKGLAPISIDPDFSMLSVYHYRRTGQLFMLMNESAQRKYRGKVILPSYENIYCYDAEQDMYFIMKSEKTDAGSAVDLTIEPGQSILLLEESEMKACTDGVKACTDGMKASEYEIKAVNYEIEAAAYETNVRLPGNSDVFWKSFEAAVEECTGAIDLTENWDVQLCRPADYPEPGRNLKMDALVPVSDLEPAFSGIIRYEKDIYIEKAPETAIFSAESVFEVMRLFINGKPARSRMTPPYQLDITGLLRPGKNHICVEVANTPGRDQLNYPSAPFDFQHDAMEPSGMSGKVQLLYK